jgi:NADH pyrophosphatase NudC (nudix superfamily)
LSQKHDLLALVKEPPHIEDVSLLETTIQEMKILLKKERKLEKSLDLLEKLAAPPELETIQTLQMSIESLSNGIRIEKEKNRANEIIFELMLPPEMEDDTKLEEQVKQLRAAHQSVKKSVEKANKASASLEKWIQENPTCPTCGAMLNEEHLLTHE